jgi:hypothetical protein
MAAEDLPLTQVQLENEISAGPNTTNKLYNFEVTLKVLLTHKLYLYRDDINPFKIHMYCMKINLYELFKVQLRENTRLK